MLILSAVRTRVAAARRSVVPALLGAPTLRRAPSAFHVWPLHVTRRGGSPLHVKIGLAALSAAGAGFVAVKAVALSMPEAGDAEVTMELQKHARRMGIDELVIAETTDDDDSHERCVFVSCPRSSLHCLQKSSDQTDRIARCE